MTSTATRCVPADSAGLAAAARVLNAGGVCVIPTDTVYGLAARPDFPEAVRRLYTIKGRAEQKPIALLAADADAASGFVGAVAAEVGRRHWPGALTVVAQGEGVRVPDHAWARRLISACGGALRVTSANLSGNVAATDVPQALADFCRWLNNERASLPQNNILAAYRLSFVAHYRLVTIHPWADGNGRMSRLVMNMLQFEFGLIPTKVLKEQKAEYIQALNDTRDQQDESIFPSVMLRLHNTNLQSEINAFVASQETDAKTIGKPVGKTIGKKLGKTAGKIVELMRNNPQITIPEIAVVVQTSESNVLQHTSKLQKQGIIRRVDGRKEGYWQVLI